MNQRLFVGNLAFQTTEDDLRSAFGAHGSVVDAKIITDRETGRSRGFGFLTMASAQEAATAIEAMNGAMIDGRALRVNEAEERRPRAGGPGGGGPGGGGGFGDRPRGGGGGFGDRPRGAGGFGDDRRGGGRGGFSDDRGGGRGGFSDDRGDDRGGRGGRRNNGGGRRRDW